MQPLDVILAQNHRQIVALLEFVRYDYLPQIQQCSIKIMGTLRYIRTTYAACLVFVQFKCAIFLICSYHWLISGSSRIVGLVQLLLKADVGKTVIEDYAACLEFRFDDFQVIDDTKDDVGILILQVVILFPLTLFVELFNDLCFNYANQSYMQLLVDNICRPAPNITHLLLRFDVNGSIERTVLKPKSHYR
jgi:nuclear pore complex protein Nup205